eukprot:7243050-Pyramimonas_sp.AAC.1
MQARAEDIRAMLRRLLGGDGPVRDRPIVSQRPDDGDHRVELMARGCNQLAWLSTPGAPSSSAGAPQTDGSSIGVRPRALPPLLDCSLGP